MPPLCTLSDGDLITIHWSGQLRTVAVAITDSGVVLRDLTDDEEAQLEDEQWCAFDDGGAP